MSSLILKLVITRDKQGNYFISDSKDEKLFVLAQLLLDTRGKEDALAIITKPMQGRIEGPRFHFFERPRGIIAIQLFKPNESTLEEDNPLEIQLSRNQLRDLIEDWQELMLVRPYHIILQRRADSDLIEMSHQQEKLS